MLFSLLPILSFALRFNVGDKVECNMGKGGWQSGKVILINLKGQKNCHDCVQGRAPYGVALEDGSQVAVPRDEKKWIRSAKDADSLSATDVVDVLRELFPSKEGKLLKWTKLLAAEDVETPSDILSLQDEEIASMPIPALLKSGLRKYIRNRSVTTISEIKEQIASGNFENAQQLQSLLADEQPTNTPKEDEEPEKASHINHDKNPKLEDDEDESYIPQNGRRIWFQNDKYRPQFMVSFDEYTMELGDGSFPQAVAKHDVVCVMFYDPTEPHCQKMMPEFRKAAKVVALSKSDPVLFAVVNGKNNQATMDSQKVESFPVIQMIVNHEALGTPFKGKKSDIAREIVEMVLKRRKEISFRPQITGLTTSEDLSEIEERKAITVIGLFTEGSVDENRIFQGAGKDFLSFAKMSSDFAYKGHIQFAASASEEVANQLNIRAPSIVSRVYGVSTGHLEREDAAPTNILSEPIPLRKWLYDKTQEVCPMDYHLVSDCWTKGPMAILIYGDDDTHYLELEDFMNLAVNWSGQPIRFGTASYQTQSGAMFIENLFQIEENELPTIVFQSWGTFSRGHALENLKKDYIDVADYPELNTSSMTKILNTYLKGESLIAGQKLNRFSNSTEKIDDKEAHLKQLVGVDFHERTVDRDGLDVILELYEPWCGLCKMVKPHLEELARMYSKVDTLMIAQMNVQGNAVHLKGLSATLIPTVVFINGRNKSVSYLDMTSFKYENMETWKEYIDTHASTPIDNTALLDAKKVETVKMEEHENKVMRPNVTGTSEKTVDDDNDSVKTLVASNFQSRVLDTDDPWFIDFYAPWCGYCKTIEPRVRQLAKSVSKDTNVKVGKCDLTRNDIKSLVDGVDAERKNIDNDDPVGFPLLLFFQPDKTKEPLLYAGPKFADNFEEYVRGGYKTQPHGKPLLSAEPTDDTQSALKTLVGKNFEERVMSTETAAFIQFYDPKDEVCQKLAPKFKALAQRFHNKEVLVAVMDATLNEVAHTKVNLKGKHPTIMFFPGDDKNEPLQYVGQLELEDMAAYLEEQLNYDELGEDEL